MTFYSFNQITLNEEQKKVFKIFGLLYTSVYFHFQKKKKCGNKLKFRLDAVILLEENSREEFILRAEKMVDKV